MFAIIKIHPDVAWKDGKGMDPLFTLKGQSHDTSIFDSSIIGKG